MITENIHFNEAKELLNYLCSWNNPLNGYVFRGHSSEHFELLPSVLRDNNRHLTDEKYPYKNSERIKSDFEWDQMQTEFILLREFYRLSDRHGLKVPNDEKLRNLLLPKYDITFFRDSKGGDTWIPASLLETAALAQHYGIPTRLLDWTFDPFIAAFFAAYDVKGERGNLAIWCFNAEYISTLIALNTHIPIKIITPPYSNNQNLSSQKGLFTHITFNYDFNSYNFHNERVNRKPFNIVFEEIVSNNPILSKVSTPYFYKLTLPHSQVKSLLKHLIKHGYGEARIYPGYKGIARQVMSQRVLDKP